MVKVHVVALNLDGAKGNGNGITRTVILAGWSR